MAKPMTSRESDQFIVNLKSAGFDYSLWDYYNDFDNPTSIYEQLLKDCDPRPPNNNSYRQNSKRVDIRSTDL